MIHYSTIHGGYPGLGNLSGDPLFLDEEGGDFRLSIDAPCIDAGNNNLSLIHDVSTDVDGNARHCDAGGGTGCGHPAVVDMGAYEYPATAMQPVFGDLNADFQVDVYDLLIVLNSWGLGFENCLADFDIDANVNIDEVLIILDQMGAN